MSRLLIVSRSMALAMRLADQHEVVEHSADELDGLLPNLDDADVLVLDLGDPVLAVNTVNQLREAEHAIPVLLVSGYQPEWEQVEAQQVDGVHVVALPITRVALLHGIAVLTGEESAVNFVESEDVDHPATTEDYPVPALTESDVAGLSYSAAITRPFDQEPRTGQVPLSPPDLPEPVAPQRWSRGAAQQSPAPEGVPDVANGNAMARGLQRLGNRPRKLQRHPSGPEVTDPPTAPTGMGLVTDPLGPRADPYNFPASDLDQRLDAEAAALMRSTLGAENGFALRTAELVRMLYDRAWDLYSVSDTAQVLADDVIERADADAAAVLVPDGGIWRVSGGVGLRPLERRLELQDSHWLITEIGSAGRAVLIEDTDIVRQQLSGAPLAAWRHLLAVPVPNVRGIVVLARGREGGPFTDRDLSAVIAPVREASALLAQAVETRRLARMLSPLRESDGDAPARS
jgi:CheY-like chemotaxis protein